MFSPARHLLNSNEIFYAFGNTRLHNVLDRFDRESSNKDSTPIKVLFLGSGDIRNALYTASKTASESHLEIHLNDYQPAVITRNILLLHIISKPGFSLDNVQDAEYLWDVWYNALWPEATAKRFLCDIKDLKMKKLPTNVHVGDFLDWMKVSAVLHEWEKISKEMTVNEVVQMREKFILDQFVSSGPSLTCREKAKNIKLDAYADAIAKIIEGKLGLDELSKGIQESIHQEITTFYSTGVCWRASKKVGNVSFNPTLIDTVTRKWKVHTTDCPFDGYLPLANGELKQTQQKGIMRQTCLEILRKSVTKYKERMAKTEIYLNIGDALEFCFSGSPVKFDVIDTSNLADYLGLANVLISCNHRLSELPGSRVLTGSIHWPNVEQSTYNYLEDGLCCPISMAPSFYGLRLLNQAEFGISYPPYAKDETHHYARFCFEKTAPFENIYLSLSEALQDFLHKLTEKCFTRYIRTDCPVGTQYYSPLTFAYVLTDLRRRLEAGGGGMKVMPYPNLPEEVFNLTSRAITDWSLGRPVKLYTLKKEPFYLFAAMIQALPQQPVHLRVALLPPGKVYGPDSLLCNRIKAAGVHFIDNVRCDVTRDSKGGVKTIEFSFILPEEHKLARGYTGALMDVHGQPVVKFDSLDDFLVQTLKTPYPFRAGKTAEMKLLTVECCTETVDSYTVHIKGQPNFRFPAGKLKVSSSRKSPCRSAHTINMSFDGIEESEPLRLTFPIPVLVDEAHICYNEQTIGLYLPKATLELWPSDYEDKAPKMNPNALPSWKPVPGHKQTQLKTHVDAQFGESIREFDQQRPIVAALHNIRMSIDVLLRMSTNGNENFALYLDPESGRKKGLLLKHAREDRVELVLMRAHLPIRQSPSGAPMILLTVLDLKESQKLVKQGKLTDAQLENTKKMFGSARDRCQIDVATEYEKNLWCYIFKLNSLKITPTKWQSSKLTANGPLMATFVSPLYTEIPSNLKRSSDPISSMDMASIQEFMQELAKSCENCGMQDGELKRCNRCKQAFYCSVACQKEDWPSHKAYCKARK